MIHQGFKLATILVCVASLLACSTSRYRMSQDTAPSGEFDASSIPPVVPKWEPLSRGGNKSPYTVRGKTYTVLPSAKGYDELGIASWYGLKFHGELTSNGEVYNMYALSAAHKSLPLPSYVSVTNQDNGRSIIVRVNDRGPFHSDRIIDLSYAAAKQLGFQKKGTANVHLQAITVPPSVESGGESSGLSEPDKLAKFVQIAAFGSEASAQSIKEQLSGQWTDHESKGVNLFVAKSPDRNPPIYRLRAGPFLSDTDANRALEWLLSTGMDGAMIITRSIKGKNL